MSSSKKIWWLIPSICLGAAVLTLLLLLELGGLSPLLAFKEGLAMELSLLLTVLPAMLLINAYPTKVGILMYAVVTGLVLGILGAELHCIARNLLMSDAEMLQDAAWVARSQASLWILYPGLLLFFSVFQAQQRRLAEIQERYAQQQDAASLLKEAELFKLRQQLQPHFLYNSLNAISALTITAPDKATEMISRLADFLRTAVKQGKRELVPLREELDYLRQYLWIEAVRFGDRLRIDWSGQEAGDTTLIPPFLLQPLMENAIRYGVYGKTGAVTISIHIEQRANMLRVCIRNPYDPSLKPTRGTGFGLEGVRRRLWLVYARQDLLLTAEADGYFETTLQIPQ
ncbi:MAG: histidine kinase [Bacteroidetes bacterium]|nr:histidine kinase [Bacteroidota bacterium]MBS1629641.1 histidine kinase [Bacteroidota bacterium]